MNKPRIVKDIDRLDAEVLQLVMQRYPEGFSDALIRITGSDGRYRKALPFETEETYYLIRMVDDGPLKIVDDEGNLLEEARELYEIRPYKKKDD